MPARPLRHLFKDDPYSGEVAYVDAEIGRLVDALGKRAWRAGRPSS
jgi:hypothetical protein